MDRNSIIGLLLIGVIIIAYSFLNQPDQKEIARIKKEQDSIASVQIKTEPSDKSTFASPDTSLIEKTESDSLKGIQLKNLYGSFATTASGKEDSVILENELIKVKLNTKGGSIMSVMLKKYKTYNSTPLYLVKSDTSIVKLNFPAEGRSISTSELYFEPIGTSFSVSDKDSNSVVMRLNISKDKYIEYIYSLKGNNYTLGFKINIVGMQDIIASNISYYNLDWALNVRQQEKSLETERSKTTVYYRFMDEDVGYLSETEDDSESLKNKVKWVAFKQQFFTSVLIADNSFDKPTNIAVSSDLNSNENVKALAANFTIPYKHTEKEDFGMLFYFGPNHHQTLKKFHLDLEELIPLGWGIFRWVNNFIILIFNFLSGFNLSYGIVILLLTIIIKVVLLPLTYKAYLSQAKMKVLKPEIDEINARKKDEPLKMQQEIMALYRKAGVNPLGGCLPMLLQLPILIALFSFFPASIELRQEKFLWAEDLSTYDSILDLGFSIPFYGDHVSLFTLLMAISTVLYTVMNSSSASTAQMPQMKIMMYIMPVILLFAFNKSSAGLSYYYFLANIISIGQQFLFRSFVDEDEIHRKIQENKKKPVNLKKSGFQKRLEEMAKARGYKPRK